MTHHPNTASDTMIVRPESECSQLSTLVAVVDILSAVTASSSTTVSRFLCERAPHSLFLNTNSPPSSEGGQGFPSVLVSGRQMGCTESSEDRQRRPSISVSTKGNVTMLLPNGNTFIENKPQYDSTSHISVDAQIRTRSREKRAVAVATSNRRRRRLVRILDQLGLWM